MKLQFKEQQFKIQAVKAVEPFEVTQEHFLEFYGHKIKPFIYNLSRPQDIESFAADSRISVIIINTQTFNATGKEARRIYMELDQFASHRPIEIISQTNPILIIDEPQSVDGEKPCSKCRSSNTLKSTVPGNTSKPSLEEKLNLI